MLLLILECIAEDVKTFPVVYSLKIDDDDDAGAKTNGFSS